MFSANKKNVCLFSLLILLFLSSYAYPQVNNAGSKENHPRIYVKSAAGNGFIKSVKETQWTKDIIEEKKKNIEKYIKLCEQEPDWLLSRLQMNWKTKHDKVFLRSEVFSYSEGEAPVSTVRFSGQRDWTTDYLAPDIEQIEPYFDDERGMYLKNHKTGEMEWVHPSKTGHIIENMNDKIMALVEDAAFLYWLTGDKKYAEFAAPVYDTYMKGMYYREPPVDLDNSGQQRLSGLVTFEVIHEGIVIPLTVTYDFLFNYFTAQDYNLDISTAVFQKWADQIIENGVADNNWNFFQARFLTYIALALDNNDYYENRKGQQYYLDHIFNITTERQIALKEAILNYDDKTGMWPESAGYSMSVTKSLLEILALLDNVTNGNEFGNFPIIEKATLASFQYLFPKGYVVGFGDAGHEKIPAKIFELLIANYRKYAERDKEEQVTALYTGLAEDNKPTRGKDLFGLFFYVHELMETEKKETGELIASITSPGFYAPNVSWFAQRMGAGNNAIMVSTVGAMGNHAHANGIAIEMFANNYVLAPDMGVGNSYWHPDHRYYYSRYPAHNTVVVDGISDSRTMQVSQPFKLENCYPEPACNNNIFKQITFSKVSFTEPKTLATQQRLTAIINGQSGKGYVLDIFRSAKPENENQKHEYFFHSLGQSLDFYDENDRQVSVSPSNDLNADGNLKAYEYFTDEQSFSSSENVKALFKLESKGIPASLMKIWIKGGENQKYFSVNGPESKALSNESAPEEMLGEKIPALVIRKDGEAWNRPFLTIFNPYIEGEDEVISNVSFPEIDGNKTVQAVTVVHSNGTCKDFIVATTSENDIVSTENLYQKGLLSIKRETGDELDFIFAAGAICYKSDGWRIFAVGLPVTISIEKCDKGFEIQNSNAVRIGVPKNLNPEYIELYVDGKITEKRKGVINRVNTDIVDFLLEKPYEKAVIVFEE